MKALASGMTLLELMIALAIFSIIGVASYRVLVTVIDIQRVGDQHSRQLSNLQQGLALIDRDFNQWLTENRVARPGESTLLIGGGGFLVTLLRGGHSNPLGLARSNIVEVAYELGVSPDVESNSDDQQYLLRYTKPLSAVKEPGTQPKALLAGVDKFTVTVITEAGRHNYWPLSDESNEQPIAIELMIDHPAIGKIKRLYKVD